MFWLAAPRIENRMRKVMSEAMKGPLMTCMMSMATRPSEAAILPTGMM